RSCSGRSRRWSGAPQPPDGAGVIISPVGQQPSDSDSPQVVVVEVTVRAHGESRESSVGAPGDGGGVACRRVVLALGAIGLLATIVAIWLGGGTGRHGDPVTARGPNGVAAAYGYRRGCL